MQVDENLDRMKVLRAVSGAISPAQERNTVSLMNKFGNDFLGNPDVVECALRLHFPQHSVKRSPGTVRTDHGEGPCIVVKPGLEEP